MTGCSPSDTKPTPVDQNKRSHIFIECLKAVNVGRDNTKYQGYSDIVDSCDSAAYRQSVE